MDMDRRAVGTGGREAMGTGPAGLDVGAGVDSGWGSVVSTLPRDAMCEAGPLPNSSTGAITLDVKAKIDTI